MPYETVKHSGREHSRWIPDGATKIKDKNGLGVVYLYRNARNQILSIGYAGNAAKSSYHYRHQTLERAAAQIKNFFDNLAAHQRMVKERRERDNAGHSFKAGDIITNSWGYDQTNVDWYRVVKTSSCYVWLQPISGATDLHEGAGPMSGYSTPYIDTTGADPAKWGFADKKSPVERHKASGGNVTMRHGIGSKWDGKPRYESWYA